MEPLLAPGISRAWPSIELAQTRRPAPDRTTSPSSIWRSTVAGATRCWLSIYHRLIIEGRRHLPTTGSFVMIANHTSHLDALCLLAALPFDRQSRAYPAAAADYFFSTPWRAAFTRLAVNGLPFDRHGDGERSLARCRHLLARPGHVLILFPEGTRSADGSLQRFRSGIGRLVAGTDVPVVPCHLYGADIAWGKGKLLPRPERLRLRIGKARNFAGHRDDRDSVATIGRELQGAVEALVSE